MSLRRLLICPDTHVPYQDKRAWKLFLKAGAAFKPDVLLHIGDLADCYSVSAHSKSPNRDRRLKWEMEEVNKALDQLDALGADTKHFIAGNHESRLERFIEEKAPELFGLVNIPALFKLAERRWTYTPYKKHLRLGKLYFTHDVGACGRYAVHRALDFYRHGVVTGHIHRIGYVVEGNLAGEQQVSANFGWLGDNKAIDYAQQGKVERDSALGFGIGYHDTSTDYVYLCPVPIVHSSCVVEGKLFRV